MRWADGCAWLAGARGLWGRAADRCGVWSDARSGWVRAVRSGRVGMGGLVREEDELAVLACVNYQGTAFFSVSQNAAFRLIRYF